MLGKKDVMPAQYIYHYTSAEVLHKLCEGIVENPETKEKSFMFHASSLLSMNDPTEFFRGYEIIWKELPEIEKQLEIKEDKFKLSKFWTFVKTGKSDKVLNTEFVDAIYDGQHSPFVICFSKKRDSLPMWTMYGDNGHGVCLKFCESNLQIVENGYVPKVEVLRNLNVISVEYGKWKSESILRKNLVTMYENYYSEVKQLQSFKKIRTKQLEALSMFCVVIATFLKHEAYDYEEESRLFIYEPSIDACFYTNRRGQMISYKNVNIPIAYLKEIIVGPSVDFKSTEHTLKQLTRKYGIEDVHISASKVPYRD